MRIAATHALDADSTPRSLIRSQSPTGQSAGGGDGQLAWKPPPAPIVEYANDIGSPSSAAPNAVTIAAACESPTKKSTRLGAPPTPRAGAWLSGSPGVRQLIDRLWSGGAVRCVHSAPVDDSSMSTNSATDGEGHASVAACDCSEDYYRDNVNNVTCLPCPLPGSNCNTTAPGEQDATQCIDAVYGWACAGGSFLQSMRADVLSG